MKDPKDQEVRREVGWIAGRFVELIEGVATWRIRGCEQRRHTVTVLVNSDCTFAHPAQDQLEAQMIFDTLEHRLRGPVPHRAELIHEGVL